MSSAVFGLVGVLLGSLSTSLLTIYRERLTTRREQAARDEQYKRDRNTARDIFQRDSILALQSAVSDLIRAAYTELDRILAELLAGPMPCCGWSWRRLEYSMINCVPSLASCAPWRAQAYGPKVWELPSGTAKKWSPCTSSSTRPSLPLCRLCTKPAPEWQISLR